MSGPTTIVFNGDAGVLLAAAAGIRALTAIRDAHDEAHAVAQAHADDRRSSVQRDRDAAAQGRAAIEVAAQAAQTRFEQCAAVAAPLGLMSQLQAIRLPEPGAQDSDAQWSAYVRALEALNEELRTILLTHSTLHHMDLDIAPGPDFSATTAVVEASPMGLSQRLLARVAHLGELPEALHSLAQSLDAEPPGSTRAELLATELRAKLQAYALAMQQQDMQRATALVVEQSLKDLGYQVEAMSHTLFVEGGVVHFRKPGWDRYWVRMRVNAKPGEVNFNVVRAVAADNNERSVLDHLAEDRWCAEFPALLKALEARGLHFNVTRRLAAGELPVQCVDASQLPQFTDEASTAPQAVPLQKNFS